MRRHCHIRTLGFLVAVVTSTALAESDIVVDSRHHKLEFENNCVRVVRATFGPGEKAAGMFDAKAAVIVSVTGSHGFKTTLGDGRVVESPADLPGHVTWVPAGRIQPENTSDAQVEYIVVEPKGCR